MLLGTLASGCAPRTSSSASAPEPSSDELTILEQQLAQRQAQLQAIGVAPIMPIMSGDRRSESSQRDGAADPTADTADTAPPTPRRTATNTPSPAAQAWSSQPEPDGDRCAQICEISAAICTLEQQICGLLVRHQGDARYQNACDRSVADCRAANEACHACTAN